MDDLLFYLHVYMKWNFSFHDYGIYVELNISF